MNERRRQGEEEEVEVEVEEDGDDESIYMQKYINMKGGEKWSRLLQDLVALGDDPVNAGLLKALRRRIGTSLYLQSSRGCSAPSCPRGCNNWP